MAQGWGLSPGWGTPRFLRSQAHPHPSCHLAGLTSGNEPWQYTMSSDVLPQPPSPTITIFSSFLAELGAAAGASIARSPEPGARSAGCCAPVRAQLSDRDGGGAVGRGYEAPPSGSWRHFCQAASRAHLLPASSLPGYGPSPGCLSFSPSGKAACGGSGR